MSWLSLDFNPIYQRYRFITLAVYGVVLLAGIVDWIYGGIGRSSLIEAPQQLRFIIFLIAMLGLFTMELLGVGHKSFGLSNKSQLFSFAVRLALIITVFLFTDLHYTRMLFLIIVLHSYLAISKILSYGIVILGMVALLTLSIKEPVLMGLVIPPQTTKTTLAGQQAELAQKPPRKASTNWGNLIDSMMGSFIPLLFTVLLARSMTQTWQDQQQLEKLNESLETSHKQLQDYANRVGELAATEERIRLARDIHDGLGHHLAATNIQLEKAMGYRELDTNRSLEALKNAQRSVQDALLDVRESVSSLREEGDTFSFDVSVDGLIRRMKHSELDIKFNNRGSSDEYSKLALMTLYRVIQEGLTNIHKHARASQAIITLDFSDTEAILEISDNGQGFDSEEWLRNPNGSFGLQGLQERLTLAGGNMKIYSKFQKTTLEAKLPKTTVATKVVKSYA